MIRPLLIAATIAAAPYAASAQSADPHAAMHMMQDRDTPLLAFSITEEMKTSPDRANIGAGVTTQALSAVDAMRQNTVRMNALIDALKRAGIAERDIQTSGFNLSPQYDYTPQQTGGQPRLTGYQVSNQLTVITADTTRIGALIDALVTAGGTNISGPSFFVAEPDAMLDSARETAMRRATERATRYARAAGYTSARLVSVSEGGGFSPQPMPVMARMASAEDAGNVIQPGQVTNGITLNVQFRMER
ncbi:MAG: SIMPL domain-containing protein [Pseudomonadota bacterium]